MKTLISAIAVFFALSTSVFAFDFFSGGFHNDAASSTSGGIGFSLGQAGQINGTASQGNSISGGGGSASAPFNFTSAAQSQGGASSNSLAGSGSIGPGAAGNLTGGTASSAGNAGGVAGFNF